jgi:hypothetical protein
MLAGDDGERANVFEENEHHDFCGKKADANPNVFVDFVDDDRIHHVEEYQVEKQPNQGMDNFNGDEFAGAVHLQLLPAQRFNLVKPLVSF